MARTAQAVESAAALAEDAAPPPRFAGGPQDREGLLAAPLRAIPNPELLDAPIESLRGAGPRLAGAAAEIGIASVGEMLAHVPHSHRDRRETAELGELRTGEEATVLVTVQKARTRPTRRRNLTILEATVEDESGPATAIWFNQRYLAERLQPGTRLLLRGKLDKRGFRVMEHELLDAARSGAAPPGLHTTGLVPVHPASDALRPQRLRDWAWQVLSLARHALEPLPSELRARRRLAGAADSLTGAHFPENEDELEHARRRLAFEELFLYQAALAARRRSRDVSREAPALDPAGELVERWLASLPFELTGDQRRAIDEIDADLGAGRAMQRLLMGEVGSGKTVVALHAMLRGLESGYQAALMAPTETLAEQHFATLERLIGAEGLPAALLTSATPAPRRRELLSRLASGELGLVVGTHALIEPEVEFARLAVAVIDEQHRFGVRQRRALDAKGPSAMAPHALHMTATPIPRTLSLTAYGDLDATTLRELPAGRRPVDTRLVGEDKRPEAYEFVRERLREGRQCFVVCPLVSESEKLQAKAATEEGHRLARGEFVDFEVGVLHGQMPSAKKAAVMSRFVEGVTDVLVATSVVEVGIDVPNATVMVIEAADRYGLSQLHQLRGRVGRGAHESQCILFADPESHAARTRLEAIANERDGFKLAEIDLTLRGEGEVLGTRQHGLPRFRVASLPEDVGVLVAARQEVLELLRRHGDLEAPALGPLLEAARRRFGDEQLEPIAA